jgi:hypothetical protein
MPLLARALDGLGENVADACRVVSQDVGVDAQGYGRVGVPEPSCDHMDRDSCQEQSGRVQVTKIMQAGMLERLCQGSDRLVVLVDQLRHERGHGIGIEGFTPSGHEDQAARVCPV